MFLKGLDLNLLVVLDVLLDETSVTRASNRLYRSQPAISGMLARLREYFGDELLIRVGHSIEITPFAAGLQGPLKEFLRIANGIANAKPSQPLANLEQTFTIVMSDYASGVLLPPLLEHLAKTAPKVKILSKGIVDDVVGVLERGSADFIVYPAGVLSSASERVCLREKILEDEWVCIGDKEYFAAKSALTIEEYSRQPLVAVRYDNGELLMVSERPFEDLGISRNIRAFVPYFSLLPKMVEGSDRIAIMHRRSAVEALTRYRIKMLTPPVVIPKIELELCWHRRNDSSHPHMWLRTTIHDICMEIGEQVVGI